VKTLVVSSTPCNDVEEYLLAAGSEITTTPDGHDAISQAEHAAFDLAVLVSTGDVMDVVETYFNLRDINPSMEIILLSDEDGTKQDLTAAVIAHAFPNTRSLTIDGLARLLGISRDTPH
jgi:DNA-binding response OmpR family regulator